MNINHENSEISTTEFFEIHILVLIQFKRNVTDYVQSGIVNLIND